MLFRGSTPQHMRQPKSKQLASILHIDDFEEDQLRKGLRPPPGLYEWTTAERFAQLVRPTPRNAPRNAPRNSVPRNAPRKSSDGSLARRRLSFTRVATPRRRYAAAALTRFGCYYMSGEKSGKEPPLVPYVAMHVDEMVYVFAPTVQPCLPPGPPATADGAPRCLAS